MKRFYKKSSLTAALFLALFLSLFSDTTAYADISSVIDSSTFLIAASHNNVDGDPGINDEDNEPDLIEDQDGNVLDEEDVKVRIYLPLVNR